MVLEKSMGLSLVTKKKTFFIFILWIRTLCQPKRTKSETNNKGSQQPNYLCNNDQTRVNLAIYVSSESIIISKEQDNGDTKNESLQKDIKMLQKLA